MRALMDSERWKRIEGLLQAALSLPAEQQDAFRRLQSGEGENEQ